MRECTDPDGVLDALDRPVRVMARRLHTQHHTLSTTPSTLHLKHTPPGPGCSRVCLSHLGHLLHEALAGPHPLHAVHTGAPSQALAAHDLAVALRARVELGGLLPEVLEPEELWGYDVVAVANRLVVVVIRPSLHTYTHALSQQRALSLRTPYTYISLYIIYTYILMALHCMS